MNPELLTAAKGNSDHFERVVEWEPPIRYALADTPKGTAVLEIGVQNGGSLLQLMGLVADIDPTRPIASVDVLPAPMICKMWCERLGLMGAHFTMPQRDFIHGLKPEARFAYADFDGNHNEVECTADILEFLPHLIEGGVIVKDDIDQWDAIPELPGMKRLDLYSLIDEGSGTGKGAPGRHGHHTAAWQKVKM